MIKSMVGIPHSKFPTAIETTELIKEFVKNSSTFDVVG
jgi:hypothetical protein